MKRQFFLTILVVLMGMFLLIVVYRCKNPKIESGYYSPKVLATHANGEHFVGSETCLECHADIYSNHLETAHHKTSAPADSETIKGSFQVGSNILELESICLQ